MSAGIEAVSAGVSIVGAGGATVVVSVSVVDSAVSVLAQDETAKTDTTRNKANIFFMLQGFKSVANIVIF